MFFNLIFTKILSQANATHSPVCFLCEECLKSLKIKKVPEYNSKNIDFGRMESLGLRTPSFATATAISKFRVCGVATKIKDGIVKNNVVRLTGHTISFPHKALGCSEETILDTGNISSGIIVMIILRLIIRFTYHNCTNNLDYK